MHDGAAAGATHSTDPAGLHGQAGWHIITLYTYEASLLIPHPQIHYYECRYELRTNSAR